MTPKRRALEALTKPVLLAIARQFELNVRANDSVDELRDAIAQSKKAKLAELRLVFALLLNPHDSEDKAILQCIEDLKSAEAPEPKMPEFSGRVAFLLKHDWERAKHEAKPWFFFLAKEPPREIYK